LPVRCPALQRVVLRDERRTPSDRTCVPPAVRSADGPGRRVQVDRLLITRRAPRPSPGPASAQPPATGAEHQGDRPGRSVAGIRRARAVAELECARRSRPVRGCAPFGRRASSSRRRICASTDRAARPARGVAVRRARAQRAHWLSRRVGSREPNLATPSAAHSASSSTDRTTAPRATSSR